MSQQAAFDDSNPPDWEKLAAICNDADDLIERGQWTKAEFDRLYAQGKKAVNGHLEFLEVLINEADPAWLA